MEKLLEELVDAYYGKQASETPSWTLEQVVEARRAMVEAIKKHGYLPIANLWMGPLVTKWAFESQTPKNLTSEEEDALLKELHELNLWLKGWIDTHEGML